MIEHITHKNLVVAASKWLKSNGHENCTIVFTEQRSMGKEIVDAIGFNHQHSILIEVKVSRSDFLKDNNKIYRLNQSVGIGNFRFYLSLPDLIKPTEIPDKWGLLYLLDRKIQVVVNPFFGNFNSKSPNKFPSNYKEERALLFAGIRKLKQQ